MIDLYPLVVFGRLLTCRTCRAHVDLLELPAPWIDADEYQCGECLVPSDCPEAANKISASRPPAPWETAA